MFVTFRIAGSLPTAVGEKLVKDVRKLKENYKTAPVDCPELMLSWKKLFKYADDNLDKSDNACYLKDNDLAQIVADSIHHGEALGHYRLHRYCIMANHVHLLIEPMPSTFFPANEVPYAAWPPLFYTKDGNALLCGTLQPPDLQWRPISAIMKAMKGSTARQINKGRGTSGTFWSQESYDHWIRNGEEYERVVDYIDNNPVKAGLCRSASEWKWSSAGQLQEHVCDVGMCLLSAGSRLNVDRQI